MEQKPKIQFMDLPVEIHQRIFRHVFFTPCGITPPKLLNIYNKDPLPPIGKYMPPLFKVCKRVRKEAVAPFFEANTWVIYSGPQVKYLAGWVTLMDCSQSIRSLKLDRFYGYDPRANPFKYGRTNLDIAFMTVCPGLTNVTLTMSSSSMMERTGFMLSRPRPIEDIIAHYGFTRMLTLKKLTHLTFQCRDLFKAKFPSNYWWTSMKELVLWFGTEFEKKGRHVTVLAKKEDCGHVLTSYCPVVDGAPALYKYSSWSVSS
jgi:hypothetical protein